MLRFPVAQLAGRDDRASRRPGARAVRFHFEWSPCCNICQTNTPRCCSPRVWPSIPAARCTSRMVMPASCTIRRPRNGFPATQALGVLPTPAAGQQPRPIPNEYSLGEQSCKRSHRGVHQRKHSVRGGHPGEPRGALQFSAAQYTPTDTAPSPRSEAVIGQPDFLSGKANHGLERARRHHAVLTLRRRIRRGGQSVGGRHGEQSSALVPLQSNS